MATRKAHGSFSRAHPPLTRAFVQVGSARGIYGARIRRTIRTIPESQEEFPRGEWVEGKSLHCRRSQGHLGSALDNAHR